MPWRASYLLLVYCLTPQVACVEAIAEETWRRIRPTPSGNDVATSTNTGGSFSKMPEVPDEIQTPAEPRRRPQPEEGSLDVLYEDEWMLVVDKPTGIVVHPTYKNTTGTLLNAVLWHLRTRVGVQPGILTRLDKGTSGLVVIALTPDVHATMQKDAEAARTRKRYLAIVRGLPEPRHGRIALPLARDPGDRRRVIPRPDGARCETRYEVVSAGESLSVVQCEPVTGRTHQIRVHLSAAGWPILGDEVYGGRDARIARPALHAWRIALPHPATRQRVEFESPLPDDMRRLANETSAVLRS